MKTYTLAELIQLKVEPVKVTSKYIYRVREVIISGKKKFHAKKINRLAFVIQEVMLLLEREGKVKEVAREASRRYMEWAIDPSPQNNDYAWQVWFKLSRSAPLNQFIDLSSCAYYQTIFEAAFTKEAKILYYAKSTNKYESTTS